MIYELLFTDEAEKEISVLKKSEPQAYKKLVKLLAELIEHPKIGTGKPKLLRHLDGIYSRRITDKHRLVYSINDMKITVLVISALGHYGDK
ncbi:Txe/YoeB family addiction module toxin [Bacteroidales bacterium OttesenSCG-928-M06]|nr:Txe/YoeB family addiction module toxin [Bacteroidales bacterium OttesenSCG-928-M06]